MPVGTAQVGAGIWTPGTGQSVGGLVLLDSFPGADSSGATESTNALNLALAALPTFQIPVIPGGPSYTQSLGTILAGPGFYVINESDVVNQLGPYVTILGSGGTFFMDYNQTTATGAFNFTNPHGYPGVTDNFFSGLQWCKNGIFNCFLDGSNASLGCDGVVVSSGESMAVNFNVQNYSGGIGLVVASIYPTTGVGWNEGWDFTVHGVNNQTDVAFTGKVNDTEPNSQSQGRLFLHSQSLINQNGLVIKNGAWVYHADITISGGFLRGTGGAGAVLTVKNANSLLQYGKLAIMVECIQKAGDAGTTAPVTISLDAANASILANEGPLNFIAGGGNQAFAPITATSGSLSGNFSHTGTVAGDEDIIALAGGSGNGPTFLKVDEF